MPRSTGRAERASDPTNAYWSPPFAANGIVYAESYQLDGTVRTIAYDGTTGAVHWKVPYGGDVVAVANGIVYAVSKDDLGGATSVTALDARDGHGLTLYSDTTQSGASRIHAYNALTGAQLWSASAGGTTAARPPARRARKATNPKET